jgi:hypothetical protein
MKEASMMEATTSGRLVRILSAAILLLCPAFSGAPI